MSDDKMICLSQAEYQMHLNEAARAGGRMVLKELGLADAEAVQDIHDLREILSSYRMAKKTFIKAAVGTLTNNIVSLVFMGFLIGAAMKLGIHFGGK